MRKTIALFGLLVISIQSYAQKWDEWLVDYSWDYKAIFQDKYSYDEVLSLSDTLVVESLEKFKEENSGKKVLKLKGFSYIPDEIAHLSQLEVMDISWCQLEVEELGKLSKNKDLIALNLFHTRKSNSSGTTVLPDSFGSLNKLKYLRMYNNGISQLPESFGNLSSLERWSFSDQIQLGLPNSVGNLKSLKVVQFYRFSETIDFNKNFMKLTNLESMHLRGFLGKDQSLGDFDWSVFKNLEELEITSKHPNAPEPTYIPKSIYTLPKLKLFHYSKWDLNKTDMKNFKTHNPDIKFKKYK